MTSSLEDIKSIDLEEWLTLATAPAPTKLKQGQTPDMQNVWTDEKPGSIITAPGFIKVGAIPSGNPVSFCINYFKTSAGTQTFVVSDNATVWTTIDFQTFTSIITGLSSSFQLRGAVIRDKLWLTNGSDAVRVFDGSVVTVLDGSLTASVIIQDLTYVSAGSAYSPGSITIAYTAGGTAGSEVVSIANTTQITVQIQSGVSTATQVLAAINASVPALALISASITGSGSHTQVAAGAVALSGGTPNVPRGRYIAYHDERVWLYHVSSNRSATFFSSLTDAAANIIVPDDPSAWDIVDNNLQISEGDADYGTGMILYRGYLHFFKQYSIWRLVGYDEYTYSRVKTRASTGTRFQESLVELDSLVQLIGVDGLYVFDGEETVRISDIIDPATASQTAFGFNQLQQPNTNNQFWEVTDTADWDAGTVPANAVIDNELEFGAADNTQAEFQAGAVLTNIDTTDIPNSIKLARASSGGSSERIGQGFGASLNFSFNSGAVQTGSPAYLTDGDTTRLCGLGSFGFNLMRFVIDLSGDMATRYSIGRIILRQTQADDNSVWSVQVNTGTYQPAGSSVGTWTAVGTFTCSSTPTDRTFDFATQNNVIQVSVFFACNGGTHLLSEIEAYKTAYLTSGQFISRTLDYGLAPTSYGNFSVDLTDNGEGINYFTESSDDGSSWDAPVACTNGGAIGSMLRRYLRWGANFTSDGASSQIVSAAYVGLEYISAIHDTGGNIFSWGPFESDRVLASQIINYYYRGDSSSGGVTSASWNLIVPGGALVLPTTDRYVQFKVEILGGNGMSLPVVNSVTINWVVGTAGQPQTLQNVAATYWRNRYWLSAAGPSATSNNTILIRGKKTFQNPWMLKDWNILSFTRYFDSLYGGSSVDGSIYQLDTGYSKAGAALDSYFETHDFTFGGFTAQLIELLIEAERTGPWNLNIGVSLDGGNSFDTYPMDLTPSTYDTEYIKRINVNYTATRFRLRFSTNGVDTPFQVHRCIAFYKLSGVRGSIRGDYM